MEDASVRDVADEPGPVRMRVDDRGRATITLRSPATRNALSEELLAGLAMCLRTAESRDDVRVVVLDAEGPAFCAGADLRSTGGRMDGIVAGIVTAQALIAGGGKPVVARVHGAVRAGGIGLVAACDIVVAADDAHFALTEARLGLAPAVISLTILPRMAPRAASELMLTGRRFGAAEARACGLVGHLAPADDVDAAVDGIVADLLLAEPQGLRETKRVLNRDLVARISTEGPEMVRLSAALFDTDVVRAATASFR